MSTRQKRIFILATIILIIIVLLGFFIGCTTETDDPSAPGSDIGDCEVVINPEGPSFLKVINRSGSYIELFFPEYAFSARVRPNACEIYGVDPGSRDLEISRCSDGNCDSLSSTINSDFYAKSGETFTIEVTDEFFAPGTDDDPPAPGGEEAALVGTWVFIEPGVSRRVLTFTLDTFVNSIYDWNGVSWFHTGSGRGSFTATGDLLTFYVNEGRFYDDPTWYALPTYYSVTYSVSENTLTTLDRYDDTYVYTKQ